MKLYKLCCSVVFSIGLMTGCSQPTVSTPQDSIIDIETWQTDQGATVLYVHAPEIPMMDILLGFDAGSARDEEQFGLAWLTGHLLTHGTENLTADQIAERFEEVGAQFYSLTSRDMTTLQLRTLVKSSALNQALTNLEEILTHVNFPTQAFERERARQLSLIRYYQQSPEQQAEQAFYQALYQQHPYAHPIIGQQETVNKLTRTQVQNFYNQFYTASNLTIAIVGDINQRYAKRIANRLADAMPLGQAASSLPEPQTPAAKLDTIAFPTEQTIIKYGTLGIDFHSPDYYKLILGNHILGGAPLVSQLFQTVREDRGLAYTIYSQLTPLQVAGPFLISTGAQNTQAEEALTTIQQTLTQFMHKGPTEAELAAAKQNIIGGFPLRLDSNIAIARAILTMGFYRLPLTYLNDYRAHIEQVTASDIQQAFNQHFKMDDMLTIFVGSHAKT
ncbi:MAG: insulinase family protein [Legionellales bacterium]|nr:insulinase family protein [Legionellales bacterium]